MYVRSFLRTSFLCLYKVDSLVKPNQITRGVSRHHFRPDLVVPHPVQHDLEHNLVPEGVDSLAVGALQGHATELSSSCYPGCKCPNALVTLLRHAPHVHGVDSFVDLEDGQLLHSRQEQGRGGEGGVGAGVVHSLQQVCTAGSLHLLE